MHVTGMSRTCSDLPTPEAPRRSKLFFLWLESLVGLTAIAQLARWVMWSFYAGLPFGDGDFARALPVSLRFDLMIAAWFSTPILAAAVLSPLFSGRGLRRLATFARYWGAFSCVVFGWVCLVNLGYFGEYRDQFNRAIFGMIDDDGGAILKTIAQGFHWERYLLAAVVVVVVVAAVSRADIAGRLSRRLPNMSRRVGIAIFGILALVIAAGAYRGGFGSRPPQQKDVFVCRADAANRLVANPVFLLRMAVKERRSVADPSATPAFLHDIRRQAEVFSGREIGAATTVSELLAHESAGPLTERASPPRQVYLFVMESYDRWPMLPEYESLGLTPALSRFEKLGVSSPEFVSAGSGTMPSVATILTGLPFNGAPQNYQTSAGRPFPTSLAAIFKRLGYKTRFVYGGYGSWQRIADFARDQGFDEVVTGAQATCDDEDRSEWGVPDSVMFAHLDALAARDESPVFTVVLSTSYHPPYALNLEKFGCEEATIPESLRSRYDGEHSPRVFSHLKYADAALGKFIESKSASDPDALFAITGDHWSRKFLNASPTLAERKSVPFVIYGPAHLPADARLEPGVHTDIAPTLVRLCAPKGFVFPTFGADLFAPTTRLGAEGNGVVVHRDGMFSKEDPAQFTGAAPSPELVRDAGEYTDAQTALSWWLLMRGDTLPPLAAPAR